MRAAVIVFPGSNCDQDCFHVLKDVFHQEVRFVWHKETTLKNIDCVILPGGFSYGDYLRCGAIAKYSPIMPEIIRFAASGGPVIGICNGFQILVESGLLPGVLMRNKGLKFICDSVNLKLVSNRCVFTKKSYVGGVFAMPIAHMEGNYFIDEAGLAKLRDNEQIVFQYASGNPNGSLADIAGICNEKGNVLGMMPHPERVCEELLGGLGGKFLFEGVM
ncbi:MAG: hypothetical protein ACD_73C00727G0001 [uncultured bacterium]|nr:MAG: hypothetical protein ACD_73C00727G0001 [uncultured bacterium]